MRRLIVLGVATVLLALTNVAVLDSVGAQTDQTVVSAAATHNLPTSVIDDIEVPYEVLDYVHMTYQGHAVINAHKLRRGGQEVYRLQIAADEKSIDSIYLFYDMNWQLLGDEKFAPPPRQHVEQQVEVEAQPEPALQPPAPAEGIGNGRGGSVDPDEPELPEEPDEPEEPEEEPEQLGSAGPGNRRGRSN